MSKKKKICLIIGAGFSKVLGGLKLTSELSSNEIKKTFEDNRENYQNPNLLDWIVNDLKNKKNFEQTYEGLFSLLRLNQYNFNFLKGYNEYTQDLILSKEILYNSLYKSLGTPIIDKTLTPKFKKIIEFLIFKKECQVEVFDLNFDEVFETLFSRKEYYNDFFENHGPKIYFNEEPIEARIFNKDKTATMNHYKIHGGLNILSINARVLQDPVDNCNYYKVKLTDGLKNYLSNKPFNETYRKGFEQEFDTRRMPLSQIAPSLIIGNERKITNQAIVQQYSSHIFNKMYESITNSSGIILIGFGNNDVDITNLFRLKYFSDREATLLSSKNIRSLGITYYPDSIKEIENLESSTDFDQWIEKVNKLIQKQS